MTGVRAARLAELAERFRVPGAVLGIARGDELTELAYGVTNVDTGVEVTPGTLFQIGSITKVYTATAVMRLVDDGRLDLDKPVGGYLPELRLADPEVTGRVTMRHLLTHTSGIDGDFFHDTGRISSTHDLPGFDQPPEEHDLVPVHDEVFAFQPPGAQTWQPVIFYRLPDGSPYLHHGLRATPRVGR